MPKKKIQHKGKPKHVSEESEDCIFRKIDVENTEEEYTTVVDFEASKKYNKRIIESNWAKYEADVSDIQDSSQGESPRTDDLNYLIQIASSDCAHFEFSSEKLWRNESNSVPSSKIFNLDLNVLSSGLACVPFHERLGLDESDLSAEDKERFEEEAKNSWKEYNLIREKLNKNSRDCSESKDVEKNLQVLEESVKEKLALDVKNEESENSSKMSELTREEKGEGRTDIYESENGEKVERSKQNTFFSENDENLEDWLDSVLDD